MTLRPVLLVAVGVSSAWCADPQPPAKPAHPVPQQAPPRVAVPAPRPNAPPRVVVPAPRPAVAARPLPSYRPPAVVVPRVAVRLAPVVVEKERVIVPAPRLASATLWSVQPRGYRPLVVVRAVSFAPPIAYGIEYQRQMLGPAPGPGYVFVPGFYSWQDNRYVWVNPIWATAPASDAVWIAPRWVQQNDQWELQEGYWQNGTTTDATEPVAPPEPVTSLAAAAANAEFPCYMTKSGSVLAYSDDSPVSDPRNSCSQLLEWLDGRGWVNLWGDN